MLFRITEEPDCKGELQGLKEFTLPANLIYSALKSSPVAF